MIDPLPTPASPPAARGVLASLSICMLLASLSTSIANVALPTLTGVFHAPFQAVQWVVLAYLLGVTTLIVSVGRLGDLTGRRRLMLAGLVLFTTASVLCAATNGLGFLIAARAAQGIGAAVMLALAMAFVGEAVPKARTGAAMGLLGTMSAIGTAMGPTLGGVLISMAGWRAIFVVTALGGAVAFWLARRFLPADRRRPETPGGSLDVVGTAFLAMTLGAYALAMTIGRGHFGSANVTLLGAAALGVMVFILVQMTVASPLIRLALFKAPAFSAAIASSALVSTVVMATLVVGPFYLARALGLGPAEVGLVMSAGPVVAALSGMPAGRLVDALGAGRATLMGLAAMAAGTLALALLPSSLGIPAYVGPIVVLTAGYALFQAANNTAVMTGVEADQRGSVSGLLNLSRNLGLITGASAMGAVFALGSGAGDIAAAGSAAVAAGMHATFAVAASLAGLALIAVVAGRALTRAPAPAVAG